jgi:Asp-tRNA(Asn)/Glu-tRNA(Gln) amidotransferase A subunit family amidase
MTRSALHPLSIAEEAIVSRTRHAANPIWIDLAAISGPHRHGEHGPPAGTMFVGPAFSDSALLDVAEIFVQH